MRIKTGKKMSLQQDAVAEKPTFQARLLKIDSDLHMRDLECLKFLCRDMLNKAKLDKIQHGHQFFELLEKAGKVNEKDPWLLVECLHKIGRYDLLDELGLDDVDEAEGRFYPTGKISDFRLTLFDISQELTDDDLRKMAYLSVKIPKAKKEKISSAMDLFTLLEQHRMISAQNTDLLEDFLKQILRYDLVEVLDGYKERVRKSVEPEMPPDSGSDVPEKMDTGEEISLSDKRSRDAGATSKANKQSDVKNMSYEGENFKKPRPSHQDASCPAEPQGVPDSLLQDLVIQLLNSPEKNVMTLWSLLGYSVDNLTLLMQNLPPDQGHRIFSLLKFAPCLPGTNLLEKLESLVLKMCSAGLHAIALNMAEHYHIDLKGNGQLCNPDNPPKVRGQTDEDYMPYYSMDAKPRGICLVINNQVFLPNSSSDGKALPLRNGSQYDAQVLNATFSKLGFNVITKENLTKADIKSLLDDVTKSPELYGHDCFVCCILSHGIQNEIYGADGQLLTTKELTKPLRATECPALAGKPKLFFMQACQGQVKQTGYSLEQDGPGVEQDGPKPVVIPDEADFLLGFATMAGYVSYRSKSQGSWYIKTLTEMLDKYADRQDLLGILLLVNNEVGKADARFQKDPNIYKQSPAPLYTLRKKVLFKKL